MTTCWVCFCKQVQRQPGKEVVSSDSVLKQVCCIRWYCFERQHSCGSVSSCALTDHAVAFICCSDTIPDPCFGESPFSCCTSTPSIFPGLFLMVCSPRSHSDLLCLSPCPALSRKLPLTLRRSSITCLCFFYMAWRVFTYFSKHLRGTDQVSHTGLHYW